MAPNEIRHHNSLVSFYLKRNNSVISVSICDLNLVYRDDVYSTALWL